MERKEIEALLKQSIAQFQSQLDALGAAEPAPDAAGGEEAEAVRIEAEKALKLVAETCEKSQQKLAAIRSLAEEKMNTVPKRPANGNVSHKVEDDSDDSETEVEETVLRGVSTRKKKVHKDLEMKIVDLVSDSVLESSDPDDILSSDQSGTLSTTDSVPSKPIIKIKLRPIEQLLTENAKPALALTPTPSDPQPTKRPCLKLTRLPTDLQSLLAKHGLKSLAAGQSNGSIKKTSRTEDKQRRTAMEPQPSTSKAASINNDNTKNVTTRSRPKDDDKSEKNKKPQETRTTTRTTSRSNNNSAAVEMPRKRAPPKKAVIATTSSDDDDEDTPMPQSVAAAAAPSPEPAASVEDEPMSDDDPPEQDNENDSDEEEMLVAIKDSDSEPPKAKRAASKKKKSSDYEYSGDEAEDSDEKAKAKAKDSDDDSDDFVVGNKKRKAARKKKKVGSDSDQSAASAGAAGRSKSKRRRIKKNSDGEGDGSDDDADSLNEDGSPSKGRKNIRKVIKAKDLEDVTKRAAREEAERKKRIEERQKLYNEYYDDKPEEVKELDKLILDFDEKTKEELISVDSALVRKLKPHQGQGVKFMWDTCFESIERIDKGPGSGCILAHCMGLGKSLQVVTLVHTLLAHSDDTKVDKVLVICPLSTVLNWVNEFKMWLKQCARHKKILIHEISKYKQNYERVFYINEWHKEGGVLIMGYDLFRNLSSETSRLKKREKAIIQTALVDPGPDLVVCDEGHLLKNSKTSLSKAVNRLKTLRRIVLTGTPLQNNLNEYYCMVQFVKPNLLGKYNEYLNRFVNPITNGQYVDSTPRDIQMMKRRAHILHKLLDGCVQRRDYAVLAPYLPIKHEYVVYVQLTPMQIQLYKFYIEHRPTTDQSKPARSSVLFADFQSLQRIWTHPRVLRYNSDRFETKAQKKRDEQSDSEGSLKDFIDNTSESEESTPAETSDGSDDDDIPSDDGKSKKKQSGRAAIASSSRSTGPATRRTRANAVAPSSPEPEIIPTKIENPTEWWMPMVPEDELDILKHSGKLMLLFSLLEECEQIGDKLLVFSQSLYSLDVIEHFLAKINDCTERLNQTKKNNIAYDEDDPEAGDEDEERTKLGGYSGLWRQGLDYFRLDGSTNIENRNTACKYFNREDTPRARLFLISTRAGGLGINLVAANRVVIFDVSWNPSHDIQSIFRIYRFGQKKPCYVYRLIAMGTMEEKIYERQVTKLAISKRVIDEHQIDRHYKENDLMELYKTDLEPVEPRPIPILPKDRLFASQLKRFENLIYKYHEHDSLLENKSEETLNEAEIKAAWEEFEAEKVVRPPVNYMPQQRMHGAGPVTSNHIFGIRSDVLLQLLRMHAMKTYPHADENQVKQLVPLLLQQLYERMQTGDTSMLQQLMVLQSELEAPQMAFNQMLGQMGTPNNGPYGMANPAPMVPMGNTIQNAFQMQQQQLIAQAQNRLMKRDPPPLSMQNRPPPTQTGTVIELD